MTEILSHICTLLSVLDRFVVKSFGIAGAVLAGSTFRIGEGQMSSSTQPLCTATTQSLPSDATGRTRWLALTVLLTGAFLPVLDFTIVNLALPSIRQSLRATSAEVQFVISAYAATYAVMLITGGRLGDLLGRKRMFLIGVAGFSVASLLCGFAGSPKGLILGRILQALMATFMAPQVLASIRILFSGPEQTRALALYGATFGLANISGQLLGGFLVYAHPFGFAWQSIFFVNIPIGVAAFVGAVFSVSENRSPNARKLDFLGVLLLSLALGCLVYPLIEGREQGWPRWMILMVCLSVLSLAGFIRCETRLSARGLDPLVEFSLFHNRRFSLGILMGLVFYMLSAFYLTFSIYLQAGLGDTPLHAGLRTLPFAVSFFLGSIASSPATRKLKNYALPAGFVLQVVGFSIVACCARYQLRGLEEGLACAGIGYGIVMPGIIRAVIGDIDERHAGLAAGIVMTALQIGAALGIAIVGGLFYISLGARTGLQAYARAFSDAMALNVALLVLGCALSLRLPSERYTTTSIR
jgi:EmrB/QacA subfamily drug resistance transporter